MKPERDQTPFLPVSALLSGQQEQGQGLAFEMGFQMETLCKNAIFWWYCDNIWHARLHILSENAGEKNEIIPLNIIFCGNKRLCRKVTTAEELAFVLLLKFLNDTLSLRTKPWNTLFSKSQPNSNKTVTSMRVLSVAVLSPFNSRNMINIYLNLLKHFLGGVC